MSSLSKLTTSKTKQFCETSPIFELNNLKNEAILRDLFIFQSWQHTKRSNSARLPQFLHLNAFDNIKIKAILRDFLQKWNVECSPTASYQCVLRFFHSTCRSTAPATKNWCQVIRSAAPVTQNDLSKPTDLMLQNATPVRKSAPWPPNISHEHVFCIAPATENASLQILFKCPTLAMVFGNATKPSRVAHFWQGAQSLAPATRNELWMSKSGPTLRCFVHFDFEMCFAPQRRALFRHLNFQKWSDTECFVQFDFEMCFAPQRRALFRHLNFQKCSDPGVLCTTWLGNVLRAKTARTFSTSQLPKLFRDPGVLYLFTWKCASRHNGVQFFISHLASWLRRFSEPTFRPSGAPNHWKNTVFRDFPTFSRICIFFLLTLSLLLFSLLIFLFSLPLPYSAFHLSILSEVWLLNFLRLLLLAVIFPLSLLPLYVIVIIVLISSGTIRFLQRWHWGVSRIADDGHRAYPGWISGIQRGHRDQLRGWALEAAPDAVECGVTRTHGETMSDRMPDRMQDIDARVCQNRCQKECQIESRSMWCQEIVSDRLSEYKWYTYFRMVCQKLCQNSVSGDDHSK